MKKRNIVVCLLLSIVTCGIYGLYWLYTIADTFDKAQTPNKIGTSPVVTIILWIVTGGIYGWYAFYKWGKQTPELAALYGRTAEDRGVLYLILSIVALTIVNYCLIQNDFNNLADATAPPAV